MWGLERRETGQGIVNRNTRKGETGSQRGRVDTEGRIKETRGGRKRLISFYRGQIESSKRPKKVYNSVAFITRWGQIKRHLTSSLSFTGEFERGFFFFEIYFFWRIVS